LKIQNQYLQVEWVYILIDAANWSSEATYPPIKKWGKYHKIPPHRHCEERFLRRGNPEKDPTHLVMAKKLFGFYSGLPRLKKRSSQ
jgi:hypothetical protein